MKKKVLFCHDGPLTYDDITKKHYGIAHNDRIFNRYLDLGTDLSVLIRVYNVVDRDKLKQMSPIDIQNTNIIGMDNFFKKPFYFFKSSKKVEEIVKLSDIIIIRLPSMIGLLVIKYCVKHKKNYLIEFVADPWDSLWNHSLKGKVVAPVITYLNKKAVKKAPNVVYVTNKFLQERYPSDGDVFACSDADFNEKNINSLNIVKVQKKKFGTLAAINVKFKGQDCVIKALGYLKKNNFATFEYELVGSGSDSYLKKVAEDNDVSELVTFKGPLKHEEVFDWLETLDGYIQPSKQEGMPRSLLEAMSCGLFCLGAKTGGIPELLQEKYIFSNKKNNYIEIANIINSVTLEEINEQGQRNFIESQKYNSSSLDEKRKKYYEKVFNI
ncbi:glycosyltransferase family 4 protein [Vagococcus fluvialis]|uniref:glycosyltransferase family 4 protein n=1 Tax=Vagococcus fluvialis TaxID=2738 RepID=UPI003D097712